MKRYDVEINGVQTTVQLSDADAKARGLKPAEPKSKTPANKAAQPANKSHPQSKRDEAVSKSFGGGKSEG